MEFFSQSHLVTSEQGEVVALSILHLETFPESFFTYFNEFLIQDQEGKKSLIKEKFFTQTSWCEKWGVN